LGAATLTTGSDGTSTAYNGIIAGSGGLTKEGAGTLTLGGNNSYSGITSITGGTLQMGIANALSSETGVLLYPGGTLDLNSFNQSIGSLSDSLASETIVYLGSAQLTVGSGHFDGAIMDGGTSGNTGGSLVKTGPGTLTLTNTANDYTGGTAINGGTLSISADPNLRNAAGSLSFDGGTVQTTGGITATRALTF